MRRIVLPQGAADFRRLFTGVRRSWFRLETLQQYEPYDLETFTAFLRGEPIELAPDVRWQHMIREHVAAGRALARVHVIVEPPSDYIRYELVAYTPYVEAGEDVRVIPVQRSEWPADVPRHDYWLFDDRDLWLMHYDSAGALNEVELIEEPLEVERHRRWTSKGLAQSIALRDYTTALSRAL